MISPLTLRIWAKRTATIRPFLPTNTEPMQVFDHRVQKLCPGPLGIKILVPQNQRSLVL